MDTFNFANQAKFLLPFLFVQVLREPQINAHPTKVISWMGVGSLTTRSPRSLWSSAARALQLSTPLPNFRISLLWLSVQPWAPDPSTNSTKSVMNKQNFFKGAKKWLSIWKWTREHKLSWYCSSVWFCLNLIDRWGDRVRAIVFLTQWSNEFFRIWSRAALYLTFFVFVPDTI